MKNTLALVALLSLLGGCASLQYAGVASYTVEPVEIDGKPQCCRVSIHNGKEIARLDAWVEKRGEDYTVSLRQWNVEAFAGQQIAADAAASSVASAVKAAGTVIVAPAAAAVGAAAIGALAQ